MNAETELKYRQEAPVIDDKAFQERLTMAIKSTGMSYRELAAKCNVGATTLSSYVCGVHRPLNDILYAICKVTGCSADWLLGLDETSRPK